MAKTIESIATIHDRVALCVQKYGKGKNTVFAEKLGISEGNIRGYIKGVVPKADVLENIVRTYDISPEWLLTGRGEMLKTKEAPHTLPADQQTSFSDKDIKSDLNKQDNQRDFQRVDNPQNGIPLVSPTVAAGFGNQNFAIAEADVKDYYTIPRFRHTHIDFMIEVTGDSMTPHLNSGDIIACAIVRDSQFIQWNKCHVIATAEQGLLVKRLMPGSDDNHLRAVSDNTNYPAFDIPKSEITGLALVIGSVCLE